MTREILFRGKRLDNGEWIFGDLRHIFHGEYPARCGYWTHIVDNSNGLNNGVCGLEVGPLTVDQFTGLTDRNGVKIFEGDIIEFEHPYNGKSIHAVVQNDCGWNLSNFYASCFDCPGYAFSDGTEYMTVIGNIYDNPELLETYNTIRSLLLDVRRYTDETTP